MNILGAGGHAKVVLDCLRAIELPVSSIIDDNPAVLTLQSYPVHYSGTITVWPEGHYVIAIGSNDLRRTKAESLRLPYGLVIHPSALVSPSAKIAEGTVVFHRALVQADSSIGRHVILNTGCQIDHDCQIGDFSHIAPGAILCGGVQVGNGVLVGAGAIVLPGIHIGDGAVIGAGAVVTKPVTANQRVKGNPAK